ARILCKHPDELGTTDMADHALAALRRSRVKTVYILGRRGPAQAAFTPAEVEELGALSAADVRVLPDEARLDEFSRARLSASADRNAARNVEIINRFSQWQASGRGRELVIRFLV